MLRRSVQGVLVLTVGAKSTNEYGKPAKQIASIG